MSTSPTANPSPQRIMEMVWAYAPPIILGTAVHIGLFDTLKSGPKTAADLAAATKSSLRGAQMIANALAGFNFLIKNNGQYELTPESAAFLTKNGPTSLAEFVEHSAFELIPNWLHLRETVRTGKPAAAVNQQQTGDEFFQKLVGPIFALSYPITQATGQALGIAAASSPVRVLDIGAGSGVWGIGLAQLSPQVQVTAVDWPGVLEVTRRMAAKFELANRFSYIAGDFQEVDFGTGYQFATVGHILHSEGAERSRRLIKKVFNSLAPGGKIVICEFQVNEDRTGPAMPLIFAVNMLVHTDQGDTFSFVEMAQWLREAGFVNPRNIETPPPAAVIVADRPV